MRDLRYAFRTLLKTPVTTAILVLSLALGIGANTAMFSLVHQLLIRSLPVPNPEELVKFSHPGPAQGNYSSDADGGVSFSYYMLRELQKKQTVFTGIAGMRMFGGSITYQNSALPATVHLVTGNYFEVLGVKPAIGRVFSADDDKTKGAHFVVVLSHQYWTTRFGANPAVLNQTVNVNGYPMTIVGVSAAGFVGEVVANPPDIFVPITMRTQITPGFKDFENRKTYWVTMMARLKPGVSLKQAAEAINAPYREMLEEDASLLTQPSQDFLKRFRSKKIVLEKGDQGRNHLSKQAEVPLFLLMGITGFVLLIACANAANLLLVRATGRRKEIAIRLSIGASRSQLIRQLLIESWTLSIAGGVLGLAVAQWTLYGLRRLLPADDQVVQPALNGIMLLYSMAASVLTGLASGLFPALQSTNAQVAPTLKDQGGQTTATGRTKFFQNSLVSGQVALSLMLLITAGLFALSLVQLTRVKLGINAENLIVFGVSPELARYGTPQSASFLEQLEDRIGALPGVKQVSGSVVPFLSGDNWNSSLRIEGFANPDRRDLTASYAEIAPGFFSTMGASLLNGREFRRSDNATAPKVAIVNETFAKKYFPSQNPIGMHFGQGSSFDTKMDTEIVGVVKDFKYSEVRNEARAVFYLPYRQSRTIGPLYYYVRTSIGPNQFFDLIRGEVRNLDPNVPISSMKTMQAQINENLFLDRMMSTFASIFALLATILAAIGLYGVLAYTVERRTREIGIRMALGADPLRVRGLILGQVALLVGIGVAIGVAGALGAGKLFESILFGVQSANPVVLVLAPACLIAVSLLAASVPARRATKIDPMRALRYE